MQMSLETFEVIGSEDCLYLNIYTTMNRDQTINGNASNLLPVLFWIHGGSFNVGSSGSDLNRPEFFLEKVKVDVNRIIVSLFLSETLTQEILVVTMNYRLGPFGFLSHSNVTGNIGLYDQRMALEWIHEYIIYFGGNKSKISLTGWSSGSMFSWRTGF